MKTALNVASIVVCFGIIWGCGQKDAELVSRISEIAVQATIQSNQERMRTLRKAGIFHETFTPTVDRIEKGKYSKGLPNDLRAIYCVRCKYDEQTKKDGPARGSQNTYIAVERPSGKIELIDLNRFYQGNELKKYSETSQMTSQMTATKNQMDLLWKTSCPFPQYEEKK